MRRPLPWVGVLLCDQRGWDSPTSSLPPATKSRQTRVVVSQVGGEPSLTPHENAQSSLWASEVPGTALPPPPRPRLGARPCGCPLS